MIVCLHGGFQALQRTLRLVGLLTLVGLTLVTLRTLTAALLLWRWMDPPQSSPRS